MLVLELSDVIKVVITAKIFDVTQIVAAFSNNIAWCWAYENNSGPVQFFAKFGTIVQCFSQSSWGRRCQGTGDVVAAVPLPVGGQRQPILVGTHERGVGEKVQHHRVRLTQL